MKNKALIFFLVCFIAVSCNKPLPDYSGQPFDFTVSGLTDISIPANDFIFFNPTVTIVSGDAANEPVTVTFKGTPFNVILKNDFSFRLNYDLMDSFGARNATPGTYPMQAIFSNPSAGTKTYNFNLTITDPVNRVAEVCGGYYPSNNCGNNIYISCNIDSVAGAQGKIRFINRTTTNMSAYGTFDTSYGMVDCCTNTFVIPTQKVQGGTISGYGTFNENKMVIINKTVTTDTTSYYCIITLSP